MLKPLCRDLFLAEASLACRRPAGLRESRWFMRVSLRLSGTRRFVEVALVRLLGLPRRRPPGTFSRPSCGKPHGKPAALPLLGLDLNATSHLFGRFLRDRQAEPGALVLPAHPLGGLPERLKQPPGHLRRVDPQRQAQPPEAEKCELYDLQTLR